MNNVNTYLIRIYWYVILYNVVILQTSNVEVFDPEESYDVYWSDASCVGRCFILNAYILLSFTLVYFIYSYRFTYEIDALILYIPLSWLLLKNGHLSLNHVGWFKFTTTYSFAVCIYWCKWVFSNVFRCLPLGNLHLILCHVKETWTDSK